MCTSCLVNAPLMPSCKLKNLRPVNNLPHYNKVRLVCTLSVFVHTFFFGGAGGGEGAIVKELNHNTSESGQTETSV